MAINEEKLNEFLGRFVTDLGATVAAGNVVIGHQLGLYQALAAGPATAQDLAERTHTNPRYITEWLRGQAAGGYVEHDPAADTYSMTEEQAFALANPDGAVYAPGAFVLALGTLRAVPRITEAFRSGTGLGWHEHDEDVFIGASSSSVPAISPTWSRPGSRRWTMCRTSCAPGPRWPTSGRSSWPASGRATRGSPTG